MMESIKRLQDSIDNEQKALVKEQLGEDGFALLLGIFKSNDEKSLSNNIGLFSKFLKKKPLRAIKLYQSLHKEQKEIVKELIDA